ncbi:MAG: LysR family transcriptional regulator [Betaproteobacteria bacterium]
MLLEDLQVFATAAVTRNLRAAADVLGVTQPAVSKSIRRLELSLGTKVFERTARGVALTRAGQAVFERNKSLAAMIHAMRTEVADMTAANTGIIRLGTTPAVTESMVIPTLAGLIAGPSALRIQLRIQLSALLLRDLQAGSLDMAIATMPAGVPADLNFEPLGSTNAFFVVRRDHPILARPFTLDDLSRQKWLLPPADVITQWLASIFMMAHCTVPTFTIQADASPHLFTSLVASTDLVAMMTENMLAENEATGLVRLPPPAPTRDLHVALFWRRTAFFSAAMERCRSEVKRIVAMRAGFGAR